jgi:tRNA (guanine37-N1)-methyltransferase
MSALRVDIVSIFPEYFAPLDLSLIGKARGAGLLELAVHDLRSWTSDVHRTVDDTPSGGGPGMVMRPEPWAAALDAVAPPESHPILVVPTPVGAPFTQAIAHELAAAEHLVFACGRYEGIDQRVFDDAASRMPVIEVSLGDYVLFGGEVAVIVILEAVTRLLPGVLGNADSLTEESHAAGLLEAPVYTKPAEWRGRETPAVLRSGDHGRIARWRRDQSLLRTAARRPDMLAALPADRLDKKDRATLEGAGFQLPTPDVAK